MPRWVAPMARDGSPRTGRAQLILTSDPAQNLLVPSPVCSSRELPRMENNMSLFPGRVQKLLPKKKKKTCMIINSSNKNQNNMLALARRKWEWIVVISSQEDWRWFHILYPKPRVGCRNLRGSPGKAVFLFWIWNVKRNKNKFVTKWQGSIKSQGSTPGRTEWVKVWSQPRERTNRQERWMENPNPNKQPTRSRK